MRRKWVDDTMIVAAGVLLQTFEARARVVYWIDLGGALSRSTFEDGIPI